jgi:hypothetical protein
MNAVRLGLLKQTRGCAALQTRTLSAAGDQQIMRLLLTLPLLLASAAAQHTAHAPFRIACVDDATGLGVPLVQLKTSNYISFYSDSAGVVAFDEPGLVGRTVYFVVLTDGYEVIDTPPDAPASEPGVLLNTSAGGGATVRLRRTQHAQRLFRLTGGGLYRDTLLTGGIAPVAEPLLPTGGVIGQDSLMAVPFKERVLWLFGDTE